MGRLSPNYVILGLLEQKSGHGYQLLEHFQSPHLLGNIWKLSTSRIYSLLKQLERQEWVTGREEDAPDAPIRTVYWLTDAGRTALFDWLHDAHPAASTRNIRTEYLSRLYIARLLGLPTQAISDAQYESCRARLNALKAQHITGIGGLALQLQIDELTVILDWIRACDTALAPEMDSLS